jgi:uncharacterized protein YjbJ (UPF0337 family)
MTYPDMRSIFSRNAESRVRLTILVYYRRREIMDKNRIVGSAKQIKGAVKEVVGKAVGDSKLESEGKTDKVEGKVQNAIGGLKDVVKDAFKGK